MSGMRRRTHESVLTSPLALSGSVLLTAVTAYCGWVAFSEAVPGIAELVTNPAELHFAHVQHATTFGLTGLASGFAAAWVHNRAYTQVPMRR
jgi:hypothetical protein